MRYYYLKLQLYESIVRYEFRWICSRNFSIYTVYFPPFSDSKVFSVNIHLKCNLITWYQKYLKCNWFHEKHESRTRITVDRKNCTTRRNIIYISNLKISKDAGFDSMVFRQNNFAISLQNPYPWVVVEFKGIALQYSSRI